MKTNAWLRNGLALLFVLTVSGCRENVTVVTTLFPDGSCDRVVTVTSDSGKVPDVAFPLPVDSSWQISWTPPGQKGEKYLFTARKHFASIGSLREQYARAADTGKIKIDVSMKKDFRWFYTYFTYTEKYEVYNPFREIPLSKFMTQEEVRRYLAGERSDSLKKMRETWEMRNMFELFYRGLLAAAEKLHDPALPSSLIEAKKDELYTALMSSGKEDEVSVTTRVLKTPAVRKLSKQVKDLINEIMHKSEVASKADGDYVCTVVMPGTILDTNSEEVKGNSVVWRFSDEHLGIADYEMRVESRSINGWALAVTGLVVLGLVFLPYALRVRRERQLVLE